MTGSATSMRHAFLANCALVAVSPALSQSAASAATCPEGHWRVADGSAVIRFERCGEDLCGRIVQLRDSPAARDEANPIRALRDRPVCGIAILTRLRPGRGGRWTGGRLYDPESGHTLSGVSVQRRGETVRVSIGSGPFAGSETWPSASAPARACGGGGRRFTGSSQRAASRGSVVEFAIKKRGAGLDRHTALVESGVERARPIIMTMLAMVAGMTPAGIGFGAGAGFRAPMAIAVVGGLISSTLLSLVFVPVVFTFMDDLRNMAGRRLGRVTSVTADDRTNAERQLKTREV